MGGFNISLSNLAKPQFIFRIIWRISVSTKDRNNKII